MLTCLRRKPVKEEQVHQKYVFDNDQSLDEEHSRDNSSANVFDAEFHNGRASGFEQADDPEQAQEGELAKNLVMEVLTACNVDVDTAFLLFRILQFRFRFVLISGYEMRAECFQMQGYFG